MSNDQLPIRQCIRQLISKLGSLQLATQDAQQDMNISYTPFICVEDDNDLLFYIFISELAQHTQNLKQESKLSVLLIEDETESKNIFARKRLSLQCESNCIGRDSKKFGDIIGNFKLTHGKTVELLETLPDFHLYQLTALTGSYVHGFGSAHKLSGKNLSEIETQTRAQASIAPSETPAAALDLVGPKFEQQ